MGEMNKKVMKWAKRIGSKNAVNRLVERGVSRRAAEQLCKGTYPSEPKAIRDKLIAEIAKDGYPEFGSKVS